MTTQFQPKPRSILARADLLRAMATGREEMISLVAAQLGLEQRAEVVDVQVHHQVNFSDSPSAPSIERLDTSAYPNGIVDIALWMMIRYEKRSEFDAERDDRKSHQTYWKWSDPPKQMPKYQPLQNWRKIGPRLHAILDPFRQSHRIDINKLVSFIARREFIRRLPRVERRRWNGELFVISDRSTHLIPYFEDQNRVAEHVANLMSNRAVTKLVGNSPYQLFAEPSADDPQHGDSIFQQPSVGSRVLVLGDLGALSKSRSAWHLWHNWGREMIHRNCELLALVPCSESRLPGALINLFTVQSWQGNLVTDVREESRRLELVEKILTLAAPADRLEPGLLRGLRLLLPEAADVSLEADVWNSSLLSRNHVVAATIDRELAKRQLRPRFESLPIDLRRKALNVIRAWRKQLENSPEIWLVEILNLSDSSRDLLPSSSDLNDARALIRKFDEELRTSNPVNGLEEYAKRFTRRASDDFAMKDTEVGKILRKCRALLNPDMEIHAATDPMEIPAGEHVEQFALSLDEQTLSIQSAISARERTWDNAFIRSSNSIVQIELLEHSTERDFWKSGNKPDFASSFGRDQYGAWFEFEVPRRDSQAVVTQRMRWIPPGSFQMGSPADEPGRYENEQLHPVTITSGFWMFDAPCTQRLWTAIMDENPSRFPDPNRPVESVDWEQANEFAKRLGHRLKNQTFELPTEAQWEYACRAGTSTAIYNGPLDLIGNANAPALDTIAWYGGNSGHKYDHTESVNIGRYVWLSEKQFPFTRAGTRQIKQKDPNPWGLYDMLGNVWEWCGDWYAVNLAGASLDPRVPESGSHRVVRGGCWIDGARSVRSACRSGYAPGVRYLTLGFRLLSLASAEPSEMAERPVAEQGAELSSIGGAEENFRDFRVRVDNTQTMQLEIDAATKLRVVSNLEAVELQRLTKPDWAVEYGRDAYGVYGDFEVESVTEGSKVQQRLRWIPPGSFQMGSPPDEPGRSNDEAPHYVTITSGFWMFDAPCSQRLWTAIMDENPSHFPDPERPVETVSWEDALEFAKQLSRRLKNQTFELPTDAQWEYACRAGISSAIYTGPLEIIGYANAPALCTIAWYGGNSGHEYDLDRSVDVREFSWLSEKQFPFTHAGTRQIKHKVPNPWGLYDMLGNVWEWCWDWYAENLAGESLDPRGPETGAARVVRGAGWSNGARHVRSACRDRFLPGIRDSDLGFRLLSSDCPVSKSSPQSTD